jgi:hypothetical protein
MPPTIIRVDDIYWDDYTDNDDESDTITIDNNITYQWLDAAVRIRSGREVREEEERKRRKNLKRKWRV